MATVGERVSWRGWLTGLGAIGFLSAGCYAMRPLGGAEPQVGTKVAFDVNDAGRVALGGSMGPEIAQLEGQVLEKDSGGYLLAVSTTRLLRGGEQLWSGEQVRVKSEYLGPAYERRFSIGRSVALGALGIGGFGAFLLTKSLLGSGTEDNPPPCSGDDCGGNVRLGRP